MKSEVIILMAITVTWSLCSGIPIGRTKRDVPCLADEDCLYTQRCYWQHSNGLPVGVCEEVPVGHERKTRQASYPNYGPGNYGYVNAYQGRQRDNFYDVPGGNGDFRTNSRYNGDYQDNSRPGLHVVHKEIAVGGEEAKGLGRDAKMTISEENTRDHLEMKDFGHVYVVHDDDDDYESGAVIGRDGTVYGTANDYDNYEFAKAPPVHADDILREDAQYENVDDSMEIDDVLHRMLPWKSNPAKEASGIETDVDYIDDVAHDPAELEGAAQAAAAEAEKRERNKGSATNDEDYPGIIQRPSPVERNTGQSNAKKDPYDDILVYDEGNDSDYDYYGNDMKKGGSDSKPKLQNPVNKPEKKGGIFSDDFK